MDPSIIFALLVIVIALSTVVQVCRRICSDAKRASASSSAQNSPSHSHRDRLGERIYHLEESDEHDSSLCDNPEEDAIIINEDYIEHVLEVASNYSEENSCDDASCADEEECHFVVVPIDDQKM